VLDVRLSRLGAAAVTVALWSSSAAAQAPVARAFDVSLERAGEHTGVVVLVDGAVSVVEVAEPARVSYRLKGTRAAGRRRPAIEPDDQGPVAGVELVAAGPDLELVIALRRPVTVRHLLAKTPEGFELRVDLAEMPSAGRAPSAALPSARRPPPPAPVPGEVPRPAAMPSAPPEERGRLLGGHLFLTPAGFASPFVDTRFGLTLGFAHAAFPAIDTREASPYTAQLAALSLRANLAVRLVSRLGLVASGTGAATSGVNAPTVLNLGANGGGTWMLGLAGIIARIEPTGTQVAARVSVEGSAGARINALNQLFNEAIASRQVPQSSALLGSLASTTGRFQWIAAQAIGSHASVQASLGWDATWTSSRVGRTEHTLDITGGVAITVDAAPWVPLAVLVEYDGDAVLHRSGARLPGLPELSSTRGTSGLFAGIYYSGRRDLLLGALGGATARGEGPARSEQQARLMMEYFF
jgi:hypothetical protein